MRRLALGNPPPPGTPERDWRQWVVRALGDIEKASYDSRDVAALDAGKQPIDATLTALAALDTSAGFVRQTGADTFVKSAAALKADQETGTSVVNPVVPAIQQNHPSAAKFWAHVTVSGGTPTLQASYNVTSITDNGPGNLIVTIATDFSSAYWTSSAIVIATTGFITTTVSQTVGGINVVCYNISVAATDPAAWSVAGFGDQ